MIIVADTGPLYALVDKRDAWHARVTRWWSEAARDIVIPMSVLPEVCYLLQTRIGPAAETAFVAAIATGELITEAIEPEDVARSAVLMREYADLPMGFVDASVIAVAERLGSRGILTTDRKHFGVVRPLHVKSLALFP